MTNTMDYKTQAKKNLELYFKTIGATTESEQFHATARACRIAIDGYLMNSYTYIEATELLGACFFYDDDYALDTLHELNSIASKRGEDILSFAELDWQQ